LPPGEESSLMREKTMRGTRTGGKGKKKILGRRKKKRGKERPAEQG